MNHVRRVAALAATCIFILPASAEAAGYADDVLADNPLTYLRLSETTGTVAQDASPNDRDGAYAGDVTLGAAGPFAEAGTAVQLAKTGGVDVAVPAASRTLELWVNPNRLRKGEQAGIAAHGDPAGDGWAFGVGTKRKLAFVSGGVRAQSKVTLPSAVWSQLTVTWSNSKVLIYLNGSLAKSINAPGALPGSSSGAVKLGGNGAGAFTGPFAGRVDEVAFFPEQLSAADIQARFAVANVPVNTAPPAISGPAEAGGTLTVTPGTWTNAGVAAPAYQWQRCDAAGDDCGDIDGATAATLVLTADDACSMFQVAETRANASGATTALSAPYGPVDGQVPRDRSGHGPGHRSRHGSGHRPRHGSGHRSGHRSRHDPASTAPGDTPPPPPGAVPGRPAPTAARRSPAA